MKKPKPIPNHLKKYVSSQNYANYTAEEHAVWRYIMRQLKDFLKDHAHPCYQEGLKKTGLSIGHIPRISDMNRMLNKFGWGAVPVSGFIPPAAFMEFQALGYLPIACEMRSVDHIHYTPAPDIVHEAAGHAPILVDKKFSSYLKAYAEVAAKAILSREDMDLYEAIRELSDAKEDPRSKPEKIAKLEKKLDEKSRAINTTSEAGYLGRMNWWTAEYGLIGSLNSPKIFGAGLLSSIGESRNCLQKEVKKLPFDMRCLDYNYDITEQQPQLFVTPNFEKLKTVLKELGQQMAFSRGGEEGLIKAHAARTVNTVELNSGLQISGQLDGFERASGNPIYLKFDGPSQLSVGHKQLKGHGAKYHSHGYSTPLGRLRGSKKCLSHLKSTELKKLGIQSGKHCVLEFESGVLVTGKLQSILKSKGRNLLMSFKSCTVIHNNKVLFHPNWGDFDMACGESVVSVFGGPADRGAFGETSDFKATKIPQKKINTKKKGLLRMYSEVRKARQSSHKNHAVIEKLISKFLKNHSLAWLLGLEIYELCLKKEFPQEPTAEFLKKLNALPLKPDEKLYLHDGLRLANIS